LSDLIGVPGFYIAVAMSAALLFLAFFVVKDRYE